MKRNAIGIAAIVAALTLTGFSATANPGQPTKATEATKASKTSKATSAGYHHKHHKRTVVIYLTRHGRTILNQTDAVQGWSDSPLLIGTKPVATAPVGRLDQGRPLAAAVGINLRAQVGRFDAAYSGDGKRHYETATYILKGARQTGLRVTQDERLREMNFGKFEGLENKELLSAAVEHLGYQIDHDAEPTAPADENGQNGGWQTMQIIAMTERGLYDVTAAMKVVAAAPELGLTSEDCTEVNARMTESLRDVARKAQRGYDDKVLVVSSGISIGCFTSHPDIRTVDGGIPEQPPAGYPNVGVTKVVYKDGKFAIDGPVGSTEFYPQG